MSVTPVRLEYVTVVPLAMKIEGPRLSYKIKNVIKNPIRLVEGSSILA